MSGTTSICKSSVCKAYQDVINDVISSAREYFLEDGVDEAVLHELKQLWQTKLAATKAVEESKDGDKILSTNNKPKHDNVNPTYINPNYPKNSSLTVYQLKMQQNQQHPQQQQSQTQQQQQQHQQQQQQQQQQMLHSKQLVGQVPPNNHMPQGSSNHGPLGQSIPEWRRVPIQLTIPSAPGSGEGHRILSIDVPEVFLQDHHLKSILTGQAISTTMGLPLATACAFLQEHVDAAFLEHQRTYFSAVTNRSSSRPPYNPPLHTMQDHLLESRLRGVPFGPPPFSFASLNSSSSNNLNSHNRGKANDADPVLNSTFPNELEDQLLLQNRLRGVQQGDAPADTSDDDDRSDDGSDDIGEERDEDEMDDDVIGHAEEEPLNSEDDVSDADGTEESFETDNVIVCQFDKITRSRNRWKFHLKDGIMNLNGEDFIFQKASGDAEW